jgi:hypothetical protein
MRAEISKVTQQIAKESRERIQALEAERHARESEQQEIRKRLEEEIVGGLHLEGPWAYGGLPSAFSSPLRRRNWSVLSSERRVLQQALMSRQKMQACRCQVINSLSSTALRPELVLVQYIQNCALLPAAPITLEM